ncbi:MAG: hypothetical protein ACOYMV_05570 [Verrucomicrobiia bacterium]
MIKEQIKHHAYALGADLVGFGGIGRCRHAPLMMSPQGIFPGAKTVVVMALRHPDACIERGGEEHPQKIGPYSIQYLMNSRLDEMSYRMATFIEQCGHGAIPIVSSNIWRYNQYKSLDAVFAPDLSHIYMAVVAGLADLGFNGLALTPEYGARNRFVTVITDAEIEEDPLIPPGTICDQCMLCRKHCPSQALSKEINGEKVLKIGDYEYRFPNKNLWRCAWGEHFDLDLDLKIPDVVTEAVILENIKQHGVRGGEMGQCLKFCLPKSLRTFDRSYSKTPMRRYGVTSDDTLESRAVVDRLLTGLLARGAEEVIVTSADELRGKGFDLERILPGAKSAVTLAVACPHKEDSDFYGGAHLQVGNLCYDLTRQLEDLGARSLMTLEPGATPPNPSEDMNPTIFILGGIPDLAGRTLAANTVVTRKALKPQRRGSHGAKFTPDHGKATETLTRHLLDLSRSLGADLAGVASVSRVDELADQLRPVFQDEEILDAKDKSIRFTPWDPEITARIRRVRTAADLLPGAKSVLVFGLRLHREVLRWATRSPSESVGPYSFETYVTNWLGAILGYQLVKRLEAFGYTGVLTTDLHGTESVTANPRGPQPDLFSNRFAALAAGLGDLTTSGHLASPEFGIRQRFLAVVTDAPLEASPLLAPDGDLLCATCDQPCVTRCPSQAITSQRVPLTCEGKAFSFNRIHAKRCDWVKRYALMGTGGFRFLGSRVDEVPPATIGKEALAEALRRHDPIKKYRPVAVEPCVIECPYGSDRN